MSVVEDGRVYKIDEGLAVSETGEVLIVDDRFCRRMNLDVGGSISFRGWKTKEMVV